MNIGMTIKARRQQSIITSFVIKVLGLASNIAKYKYLKKWTSIENLSQNLIKNSHKSVYIQNLKLSQRILKVTYEYLLEERLVQKVQEQREEYTEVENYGVSTVFLRLSLVIGQVNALTLVFCL